MSDNPAISDRAVPSLRKAFGARVRAMRKERRLSQEVFGRKAELSGKFIGEVERGEKSISLDSLYRVARALGVAIPDLIPVERKVPAEAQQLYAFAARKPAKAVRKILAMARAAAA